MLFRSVEAADPSECCDVIEAGHAAASDDASAAGLHRVDQPVRVRSVQGPVSGDVGDDEGLGRRKGSERVLDTHLRLHRPAVGGEPAPAMVEPHAGIAPSSDDAVLWVDNQSAITTAKAEGTKPKSRHYALRYLRVRDFAKQIMFCPTNLMKADPLTKLECSVPQRRLILHHVSNPVISDPEADAEEGSDFLCCGVVYSAYLGYCA